MRRHAKALGIRRYVQSTRFDSDLAAVAARVRGAPEPFDGVAELWFDSREAMEAGFSTKAGRAAGRALLEDEARFIDLENSPIWFATEREIVGGDRMTGSGLAPSPFGSLVGSELRFWRDGEAEVRLPFRDDLLQRGGFIHGAVLSYLADTALLATATPMRRRDAVAALPRRTTAIAVWKS